MVLWALTFLASREEVDVAIEYRGSRKTDGTRCNFDAILPSPQLSATQVQVDKVGACFGGGSMQDQLAGYLLASRVPSSPAVDIVRDHMTDEHEI